MIIIKNYVLVIAPGLSLGFNDACRRVELDNTHGLVQLRLAWHCPSVENMTGALSQGSIDRSIRGLA